MKIFCIGFNKTGTTTLHHTFLHVGLNSVHGHNWTRRSNEHIKANTFDINDAFTDGEMCDYVWLKEIFPNAIFILNTRNLKNWLISRYNHVKINKKRDRLWTDNSGKAIKEWILVRNNYHKKVLDFFGKSILIMDIEKYSEQEVCKKLSKKIKIPITELIKKNCKSQATYYKNKVSLIDKILKKMKITKKDCDKIYISHLIK